VREAMLKAKTASGVVEDQIDSSAKPEETKQQLTAEEDLKAQDDAFNLVEAELEQIFLKIQQKAQFLMKMQIPLQFLSKNRDTQSCVHCVLSLL